MDIKKYIIGFVFGVLITTSLLGVLSSSLKAKDRSISDELVRIEGRIDTHEAALKEIINFLNQAQKPK